MRAALAGLSVLLAATLLGPRPSASAQDQAERPYPGVVPGTDHPPPRVRPTAGGRATLVTWPGFQSFANGASRFFVQTSAPVEMEARAEGDTAYVVLLKNTRLGLRNNGYPLETQHFPTPVRRARAERRGSDVAFVLELREPSRPRVTTEMSPAGYYFVHVVFPPSRTPSATPTPPAASQSARSARPSSAGAERRPLDPSLRALDAERPPGQAPPPASSPGR